jgi:hypothetical protein
MNDALYKLPTGTGKWEAEGMLTSSNINNDAL